MQGGRNSHDTKVNLRCDQAPASRYHGTHAKQLKQPYDATPKNTTEPWSLYNYTLMAVCIFCDRNSGDTMVTPGIKICMLPVTGVPNKHIAIMRVHGTRKNAAHA